MIYGPSSIRAGGASRPPVSPGGIRAIHRVIAVVFWLAYAAAVFHPDTWAEFRHWNNRDTSFLGWRYAGMNHGGFDPKVLFNAVPRKERVFYDPLESIRMKNRNPK